MAVSLNGDGTITGLSTLSSVTITGLTSLTTTDLTADTTTLVVDSANNRVGIGTASPSTTLQVVGTATATAFSGPLTGNVTGDVSGNAGTVTNGVYTTDIGSTVQAYDADLTTLAGLSSADSNFIVGSATGWVVESGATVRTSLGLGTAATTASTDYATAAQGTTADSALQPGDNISTLTNNSGYITGNQTITLSGDATGSGTTAITVTVVDDSHNHIISNVDGLQTALDAKAPTASPTFTGTCTATAFSGDGSALTNLPASGPSTTFGDVGTYGFFLLNNVGNYNLNYPGQTAAASYLRYQNSINAFYYPALYQSNTTAGVNGSQTNTNGTVSGTWRNMGPGKAMNQFNSGHFVGGTVHSLNLWVRIS